MALKESSSIAKLSSIRLVLIRLDRVCLHIIMTPSTLTGIFLIQRAIKKHLLDKPWFSRGKPTCKIEVDFLTIIIFRQHAASIYGFVRQSVLCVKKKFRPLLSKVRG